MREMIMLIEREGIPAPRPWDEPRLPEGGWPQIMHLARLAEIRLGVAHLRLGPVARWERLPDDAETP